MKVYFKDENIATRNLTPGTSVYGEELIQEDVEYRIWNPRRSKLAAALLNGLKNLELDDASKVLYLGASTGTTVSHISDIVTEGRILCSRIFTDYSQKTGSAFTPEAKYCSDFR